MSQEPNPGADAPKPEQSAQSKPTESKAKVFANVPILPKSMRPEEAPKVVDASPKIVNNMLGDTDLHIKLTLEMEGRTATFLPLSITKNVYEGLGQHNRGFLHLALTQCMEELKNAASVKINAQLGYEIDEPEKKETNGKHQESKDNIPPYTVTDDPEPDINLHTPPGVDPGMQN